LKVLITGGSGFIGSHVVDRVLAAGHEPRLFDLVQSPYRPPRSVDTVVGDIVDPDAVRAALAGCDAAIHLAAVADVDRVALDPTLTERVNVRGTQVVLEAAREVGVERVLFASTVWVYGETNGGAPVDEDTPLPLPRHFYTATKLAGELYCSAYRDLYGLEPTILRLGIPFGPRARPTTVVAAFVARARAGQPLTIAGDGRQARRFVFVEDLADGIVAALRPEAAGRVYNLVGSELVTVRTIADVVRELVADVGTTWVEERTGDLRAADVSGARASRELGWRSQTPFAEGVRRYVDWVTETAGTPVLPTASSTNGSAAAVLRQEPAEL
jgi:UDP-glucose 4-epimerase